IGNAPSGQVAWQVSDARGVPFSLMPYGNSLRREKGRKQAADANPASGVSGTTDGKPNRRARSPRQLTELSHASDGSRDEVSHAVSRFAGQLVSGRFPTARISERHYPEGPSYSFADRVPGRVALTSTPMLPGGCLLSS